jgi:hypothetical protein
MEEDMTNEKKLAEALRSLRDERINAAKTIEKLTAELRDARRNLDIMGTSATRIHNEGAAAERQRIVFGLRWMAENASRGIGYPGPVFTEVALSNAADLLSSPIPPHEQSNPADRSAPVEPPATSGPRLLDLDRPVVTDGRSSASPATTLGSLHR